MIKTVIGDILTPVDEPEKEMVLVCHQVNCMGVMGAGLAKQIKDKHPEVFDIYLEKCNAFGSYNLGDVQLCSCLENGGYMVANIFAQEGYGKKGRFTDYNALIKALSSLRQLDNTIIRIPYKMGCGLGGGDWETVMKLINSELVAYGRKVEIWKRSNEK